MDILNMTIFVSYYIMDIIQEVNQKYIAYQDLRV